MQEGREVQGKSGTGIIPNIIYYLWCYGWWKGLQLGITALCSYCHSAIPHPDVINGYWFRKRGCSRSNLNRCDFSFFYTRSQCIGAIGNSLKGPKSTTPLFLFTFQSLAIRFYLEHVQENHCETTKGKGTYFQEHNLDKEFGFTLHYQ